LPQPVLGKNLIEECQARHPTLRAKLNAFVATVEGGSWKRPVDPKCALGSADRVGCYYAIDVGGKKGARVVILVQFSEGTIIIHRIFTDHDEYMRWSQRTIAEHARQRKQSKKKSRKE